jgi:hypothetical protein
MNESVGNEGNPLGARDGNVKVLQSPPTWRKSETI